MIFPLLIIKNGCTMDEKIGNYSRSIIFRANWYSLCIEKNPTGLTERINRNDTAGVIDYKRKTSCYNHHGWTELYEVTKQKIDDTLKIGKKNSFHYTDSKPYFQDSPLD